MDLEAALANNHNMDCTVDAEEEERKNFYNIIAAFKCYRYNGKYL